MSATGFGEPPHVAQRSRRDKLRFHHAGADILPVYDPVVLDFAHPPPAAPANEAYMSRGSGDPSAEFGYLAAAAHGGVHELPQPLPSGSQFYHNHLALHEVVSSNHALELSSVVTQPQPPQPAAGSELWLPLQYDTAAPWMAARAKVEQDGGGFAPLASQALSLTLSSNPVALQELPAGYGGSLQSVVGSSSSSAAAAEARRGATAAAAAATVGPLGPFTGYAAVLKSSRFLKPAQQLLDELCSAVAGMKVAAIAAAGPGDGDRSSSCGRALEDLLLESGNGAGGNSGASSSSLNSSTEAGGDRQESSVGGRIQHQRPEFQHKKAKLLYMQEEVCKRYKQYHQQMQMVISSFESVPGLSSATPYASLALKAISKHFRRLKNIISNQIQQISRLLGEELISLPSSSGGKTTPRIGFMEQNQPVWRPQRGLPERAVSVLRAWLFDHFLHPYPTDTDKHMLATQTGLSRNQVSNWFINARVRLWKPMVEEIHMLEARGSASTVDPNSAPAGNGGSGHSKSTMATARRLPPDNVQMLEECCINALDCTSMESVFRDRNDAPTLEAWHCEKRSRVQECNGIQGGIGGNMMSFAAPYTGRMDIGGFAPVSLTLGLRHDGSYQQQQQQQHFGSQILRDFVG